MIKFSRPRRHVDHPVSARGMGSHRREELREALRGREANEALRKLAVRLVLDKGMMREAVADMPGRSVDRVDAWTERYREGGLAALRDLPRPGRPPKAPRLAPCTIVWGEHTAHVSPALLCDAIEAETGVRHRPTSVRRLLRAFGFSRKRPALVHVNRAGPDDIRGCQAGAIPEPRAPGGRGPRAVRAGRADPRERRREGRKAPVARGREGLRPAHGEPRQVRRVRGARARRQAVLPHARPV